MAFTYRIINDYRAGMPQTPLGRTISALCVALHDTEGGVGDTGARGTIQFLIDRADRNASYHEIWAWNESSKTFTVFRIVRPTSAAHSVNPHPPAYAPDATVRAALGTRVGDPNAAIYAVSIAGKVGDVNRWSADPDFVAACKRRLLEIKAELNVSAKAEHFRFNPSTRSDWGKMLTPAIDAAGATNMADIDTYMLETVRIDGGAAIRDAPADSGNVLFMTGNPSGAVTVGTKNGYHAFWVVAQNRWGYTKTSANILSREPFTGGTTTVEVPTGITQAELDAAEAAAFSEGETAGVKKEKSRLRTLLGL